MALPESEYTALAADGAQGLWAFGTMSGPGLDLKVPFAERWDGSRWHLKSIREPALSLTDEQRYLGVYRYAFITAAVAVSPNDAWGVGFEGDGSLADDQIHAWHWDGSRWHLVPIQGECGGAGEDMTGIAAVSPHDLWATGYAVSDECTIYGKEGGFIERRQRDSWHVVENRGPAVRFLSGISATSSSDVWAVGDVIEHWDGRRWRIVPSPNIGPDETLAAVAAVSPADAWAVGGGSIERFSCR